MFPFWYMMGVSQMQTYVWEDHSILIIHEVRDTGQQMHISEQQVFPSTYSEVL